MKLVKAVFRYEEDSEIRELIITKTDVTVIQNGDKKELFPREIRLAAKILELIGN